MHYVINSEVFLRFHPLTQLRKKKVSRIFSNRYRGYVSRFWYRSILHDPSGDIPLISEILVLVFDYIAFVVYGSSMYKEIRSCFSDSRWFSVLIFYDSVSWQCIMTVYHDSVSSYSYFILYQSRNKLEFAVLNSFQSSKSFFKNIVEWSVFMITTLQNWPIVFDLGKVYSLFAAFVGSEQNNGYKWLKTRRLD